MINTAQIENATLCPECNKKVFKAKDGNLYGKDWRWVNHTLVCSQKLEVKVVK